jgi:hypothetical protein
MAKRGRPKGSKDKNSRGQYQKAVCPKCHKLLTIAYIKDVNGLYRFCPKCQKLYIIKVSELK